MTLPSDRERRERLEFVHLLLQRRHAYLAAGVLRLGKACFADHLATAAIVVHQTDVQLLFNPAFFDSIDNFELGGVMIHEAMHFLLRHIERTAAIQGQCDRFLFGLACEAVINDLIAHCFKEFKLPGDPVTGKSLLGIDVHQKSAEDVLRLLREQADSGPSEKGSQLSAMQTTDDHSVWVPENGPSGNEVSEPDPVVWSDATSALVEQILADHSRCDPSYGDSPLGRDRELGTSRRRFRKDLSVYLLDTISSVSRYETIWTRPNRKLISAYPDVILPSYEFQAEWNILIALDTSGSVPASFLASTHAVARRKIPHTRVTIISFDTEAYTVPEDAITLKGGGGTRVQAVEEFAKDRMESYPDYIFVLTDGFTPSPTPAHPERWIWILPPWGSTKAVPAHSKAEFFEERS